MVENDSPQVHLLCRASRLARRARIHAEGLGRVSRWRERRHAHEVQMSALRGFDAAEVIKLGAASLSIGRVRGLCLLVDFPDRRATVGPSEVWDFLNLQGYSDNGNAGSVRDYFRDVSRGLLDLEHDVPKWICTASQPTSYWADPHIPYGQRASELVIEALQNAQRAGYDFARLTSDGALVTVLSCVYPGDIISSSPNTMDGLWPHQDMVRKQDYEVAPGIWVRDYQILNAADALHLFTYCHEAGHLICDFNDLYDETDIAGVGDYCVMGYGGRLETAPVRPCGYHLFRAGWTSGVTTLEPGKSYKARADVNEVFIYPNRNLQSEYFLVENRSRAGRDRQLPGAGLAIWHVDTTGSNKKTDMTPDSHYECSLEQADGLFQLETVPGNFGDVGDLFHVGSLDRFGKDTRPDSRWWDGTDSGLEIRDISQAGGTMTFRLK